MGYYNAKICWNSLKRFLYSSNSLQKTTVIKIDIEEITGKNQDINVLNQMN